MSSNPPLCPCESGLAAALCCSLPPIEGEPPIDDAAVAEAQAGAEALRRGDREVAERSSIAVLELWPRSPVALATLAEIRTAERKIEAAAALLARLAAIAPSAFWPVNKLCMIELGRGDIEAAERHARQGVRLAPTDPQAHNLMGMVMTEAHRHVVGEFHCRRALDLSGRRVPLILANLATCLKNQGRIEEARALYKEADALAPGTRQTLLAWAQLEEADRELDVATALLARLDALGPPSPQASITRASILGRQKRYEDAVAFLNRTGATAGRPLRPIERLERGRLLDKMGLYDEAWKDFEEGKAQFLEATGHAYAREEAVNLSTEIKSFFVRDRLDMLPRAGVREDVPQPIFILGFPRSGTTLLEQTLSASPAINAGDELGMVYEIAEMIPRLLGSPWTYPGALTELWMGDQKDGLDRLRDHYLLRARQLGATGEGALFFTDKMPLNEVHLGLIALLFPKAPLLHLVRHPLDIMVSAMSNMFTHGHFCGCALNTAAEHLVMSADLVAHYRREMDLRYLPVRYEDMVDRQEDTITSVFDFLGVDFDPAFLQQETNRRYARTASYAQVTEKLYDRSRYRYRNYLPHLTPAIPILEPLIERLGYTI